MKPDVSDGSERPPSQAPGAWQRMQYSPASTPSWFAIVTAASQTGSRAAWPIMLLTQPSQGSLCWLSPRYSAWQKVQERDDCTGANSISSGSGCVPG